jgi:hypothetical protein
MSISQRLDPRYCFSNEAGIGILPQRRPNLIRASARASGSWPEPYVSAAGLRNRPATFDEDRPRVQWGAPRGATSEHRRQCLLCYVFALERPSESSEAPRASQAIGSQ